MQDNNAKFDHLNKLSRIVALLLSLAGLAESASRLPYTLRVVLLFILRQAEPAGRSIVAQEATLLQVAPWLMSPAEAHHGNSRAAALSLALCFRMLALALANLKMLARRFACPIAVRVPQTALPQSTEAAPTGHTGARCARRQLIHHRNSMFTSELCDGFGLIAGP